MVFSISRYAILKIINQLTE